MAMSDQDNAAYLPVSELSMGKEKLDLDVCIRGRRSVRAFNNEPVCREDIESVLEAGVWAPTAMDREPWCFIVIQDKQLIKYVSEETKVLVQRMRPSAAEHFQAGRDVICYDAPVLILVCAKKEKEEHLNRLNLLDCVLAAENMFLKAYELGLGTCYMGSVSLLSYKPDVLCTVGLPDDYELMVPFVLGHPKTEQRAGRRNEPKILKWTT